jgi:hypothetical protein
MDKGNAFWIRRASPLSKLNRRRKTKQTFENKKKEEEQGEEETKERNTFAQKKIRTRRRAGIPMRLRFFLAGWLNHVLTRLCQSFLKCPFGMTLLCFILKKKKMKKKIRKRIKEREKGQKQRRREGEEDGPKERERERGG